MHKLLPFRQYNEKDVINLFSLDVSGDKTNEYTALKVGKSTFGTNTAANWSGTAVKAGSGTLGGADPTLTGDAYLGAIGSGDQGFALSEGNAYPQTNGTLGLQGTAAHTLLGITIRSTLAYDENHEKLLYYTRKLDELQAVLPGQAVPVATRGMFTMTCGASGAVAIKTVIGSVAAGNGLVPIANGQFTAASSAADQNVGIVLAKGTNGGSDCALVMFGSHA
jgi:hypothetical protein